MEDDLFVPEHPNSRKRVVIRYVPVTVLLQCTICGNPLEIQAKSREKGKKDATVMPCRHCIKKAREDAAKPYRPIPVFDKAIEERIKTILESE